MRDPYAILQVAQHAEIEVIESAYRRLARKYHPDANPSGDASERMKDINWAYEILRNPLARADYDRRRHAEAASSPPHYAPHPRPPQSTPDGSSPPPPGKPSSAPPPLAPKTSLLQKYWIWIALTIAAYFLFVQPQLRGSSPVASLDDSAAGDVPSSTQRDPYSDCVDWTAAHLYDGETKCVIGMIVVVTQQFDRATAAEVWIAHFSFNTRSDFKLVSVDRDISDWQGKCVAVYGTLIDRDSTRDYAEDPQPGMVDSDPFDARGFTISAAPSDKCG